MGYEIQWEPRGVCVRYFGFLSPTDVHASVEAVGADPRFDDCLYRINDFRDATGYTVQDGDLKRTAAISWAASLWKPARLEGGVKGLIANVVSDDSMIEPIRKYFALDIVPYEYGVFRSIEEARDWIAARTRPGD